MKNDLQILLTESYSTIFKDMGGHPKYTGMAFGIECHDGWFKILDEACRKIQNVVEESGCEPVVAFQIKEKWAGMRFYYHGGNDKVLEIVDALEKESNRTCELCGTEWLVGITGHGWILRRCVNCWYPDAVIGDWFYPNKSKFKFVRIKDDVEICQKENE